MFLLSLGSFPHRQLLREVNLPLNDQLLLAVLICLLAATLLSLKLFITRKRVSVSPPPILQTFTTDPALGPTTDALPSYY